MTAPTSGVPAPAAMLTIGQLADYVGVTVRAVRHYHQRGLLAEPARDSSGYRRYGAQAVLDLIRIKILSDAGVPLARIDDLLSAGPEQFAESVAQIDGTLRRQIRELQRRRRQIADLAGGQHMFLAPELAGFLDELRAAGVSERAVQVERDGWILLMARYPERAIEWLEHKRADLANPELQRLYREYEQAADWDPADPRLERLADAMVRYLVRKYPSQDDMPNLAIDDPAVIALLSSYFGSASSPALERLGKLADQQLEGHWLHQWALTPGTP
jgi:DNA-binding transcriptional MerR regulator